MPVYAVTKHDDQWLASLSDGDRPIINPDGSNPSFLAGWTPVCIFTDVPTINILFLDATYGDKAVWFLNKEMMVVAHAFEQLVEDVQRHIRNALREARRSIWTELVCSRKPKISFDKLWLLRLPEATKARLFREPTEEPIGSECQLNPLVYVLDQTNNPDSVRSILDHWDEGAILQILKTRGLEISISAIKSGYVSFSSPFDGNVVKTNSGFCLTHAVFAYKLWDEYSELVFFVLCGLWWGECFALYIPKYNLTIFKDDRAQNFSHEFLRKSVSNAFGDHVRDHWEFIEPYLLDADHRPLIKYHQDHIGHHLWNELSGLSQVVAKVPLIVIPDIYLINPELSEMFGKIDDLFPTIAKFIIRQPMDQWSFMRHVYKSMSYVLVANSDYISKELATRIIDLNESMKDNDSAKLEFNRLKGSGYRFFLIGLRLENRTLVDILDFCVSVVEAGHQEMGRIAVIIDGHNSILNQPQATYGSFAEASAKKSLTDLELEVVDGLIKKFSDNLNIKIISTISAPVSASIFWCNRSEFFVTPWGAGLAKYRWVCNRPGLVVSSRQFLTTSGFDTVHLYDSPKFMENPTPLRFISPNDVVDAPEDALNIDVDPTYRVNFRVNRDAIFRNVHDLNSGS